ncbi:MAG: Flp family type IVb pilin [Candidatus Omnitrophica bacterium]|nr:Flp family type IVb pilin [Candidatus Omnitrophota bacterium]
MIIKRNKRGQTMMEYTTILGVISLILIGMTPQVKTGVQSMIKLVADQIGNQTESDQQFDQGSYLVSSMYTQDQMTVKNSQGYRESLLKDQSDTIRSYSNSYMDLGFQEDVQ